MGSSTLRHFSLLTDSPIDSQAMTDRVRTKQSGAVVTFSGDVRDHDGGRQVSELVYEAHPGAAEVLEDIAQDFGARSDLHSVVIAHRIGNIPIGETALFVAVSSSHRDVAFSVCIEIVDEVKAKTPVWKHQFFVDGTDEWVNSL